MENQTQAIEAIAESHGISPEQTVMVPRPNTPNLSAQQIVSILGSAVERGDMTKDQARRFRAQLGISNSFFTKKKKNKVKTKHRAKIAKASRRMNRRRSKG